MLHDLESEHIGMGFAAISKKRCKFVVLNFDPCHIRDCYHFPVFHYGSQSSVPKKCSIKL